MKMDSYTASTSLIEDTNKYNMFTGILGALIGALIGAIPWAIVYSFGWFVGWLGFLIGFCAFKGYIILKGKPGKIVVPIVIAAILTGVVAGQVIGDLINLFKMVSAGEIEGATHSDIFDIYLFVLPEYYMDALKSIGLGLVFAALGCFSLIKNMLAPPQNAVVVSQDAITVEPDVFVSNVESHGEYSAENTEEAADSTGLEDSITM